MWLFQVGTTLFYLFYLFYSLFQSILFATPNKQIRNSSFPPTKKQSFGEAEVSGEELHEILKEIDTNMNGQVELDEYLQVGNIN